MLLGYGIKKSGPFGSLFRDAQGCCYFLSATNGNREAEAVKIVAKKVAREGLHIGRYSMPGKRSCQGKTGDSSGDEPIFRGSIKAGKIG
jgi:hypothetical protein